MTWLASEHHDRGDEHAFHTTIFLGDNDAWQHEHDRHDQYRKVDDPLVLRRQGQRAAQQRGNDQKIRSQHGVEREYADVEPQQLLVAQDRPDQGRYGLRVAMHAHKARARHDKFRDRDTGHRQGHHQPKDAGHADEMRDDRAKHERNHERCADGDPDQRHRLGAIFFLGQIGDQRQDDRADRTTALQRTSDNHPAD